MTQNQLEIVMLLHDRGISHTKIAEMLEVSTTTVKRACARIEKERKSTSEQYPIGLQSIKWTEKTGKLNKKIMFSLIRR